MIDKIWKWLEQLIIYVAGKVIRKKMSDEESASLLQFVKFGIVGILNNVISYGTYLIMVTMGMHYTVANFVGFSVSVLNSYYWNNKYVFAKAGKRIWWKTLLKTYISYAGTGIILSNVLLILWIEILCVSEILAPIINLIVTIPINYIVNKLWAYRE